MAEQSTTAPTPVARAPQDRGQRAERGGVAHCRLAERHRQLERASLVHDDGAAERLRHEIAPRVARVRAGEPEPRDREHGQPGVLRDQLVSGEVPVGQRAESRRLDDEIDTVEEPGECGRRGRCGLDDETPLVRVKVREHPRIGAECVAFGRLDLRHVGSEVGEDLAAPSRGDPAPELDDADVAQCLSHGRRTYGKLTSTSFHIRSPTTGSAPTCRRSRSLGGAWNSI